MTISEKVAYLKGLAEGLNLDTEKSKEGKLISVMIGIMEDLAMSVEDLEVTETDPGFAGNTATNNVLKPATLETGAEIKVPLFVNPGDKIKIDTRTGEYLERCKA